MPSADALQSHHEAAIALRMRLIAIDAGTSNWHEWHQTGVLFLRFAHALYILHGTENPEQKRNALTLIEAADRLFVQALARIPTEDPLARPAVLSDREWGAVLRYRLRNKARLDFSYVREATSLLELAPATDERPHRVAIAHGIHTRAYWMLWITTILPLAQNGAEYHHNLACQFFQKDVSQDNYQAYISHLIHVALLLHEGHDRAESRKLAMAAYRLARTTSDRTQCIRALAVAALGVKGEAILLRQKYPRAVFEEVIAAAKRLQQWPDSTDAA
jgi:hypothetical protein